jgi:thiol-disulfide isomerase/thioredoxin
MLFKNIVLSLLIILIGLLYLLSGIAKGIDIISFVYLLKGYQLSIPDIFAAFISSFEILLGFSFLFFIKPQILSKISVILISIFTIFYAYSYFIFGIEDCGCFGSLIILHPALSFLRNFFILFISWFVWKNYPTQNLSKLIKIKILIVSILAFASFSISSWKIKQSKIISYQFKDKNIETTILAKLHKKINNKDYLLFVFLPTCSHCQKAIPRIEAYKKSRKIKEVVGIYPETFDSLSIKEFKTNHNVNFNTYPISGQGVAMLTNSFPLLLHIKNDTIIAEYRNYIP